jgi:hypothetical protein
MGGGAPGGIAESILTHCMSPKGEADKIVVPAKTGARPRATK